VAPILVQARCADPNLDTHGVESHIIQIPYTASSFGWRVTVFLNIDAASKNISFERLSPLGYDASSIDQYVVTDG